MPLTKEEKARLKALGPSGRQALQALQAEPADEPAGQHAVQQQQQSRQHEEQDQDDEQPYPKFKEVEDETLDIAIRRRGEQISRKLEAFLA